MRWATVAACALAILAGERGLDPQVPAMEASIAIAMIGVSNLWLWWWVRRGRTAATRVVAGLLISGDVLLLSWLLLKSGGVLNPASVFYLVQIVLAALVLGPMWTWVITGLSVGGYALLFLGPTDALRAAQTMHPEIALHMRGMWLAFALTALFIGVLVARLAVSVERGDRALHVLHDRHARASRFAGLTTAVAGAAHELGTPLSTIAVAAHELECALAQRPDDHQLHDDARLIRTQIDRCRELLNGMAGQITAPIGEAPARIGVHDVVAKAIGLLRTSDRSRVVVTQALDVQVIWPAAAVAQAVANVLRNALQASAASMPVRLRASLDADGGVSIVINDSGSGMAADVLARAGEPFFTTKTPGEGTGLGLFVTRLAIEQMGGVVELASIMGEGTTATIVLPRDVVEP